MTTARNNPHHLAIRLIASVRVMAAACVLLTVSSVVLADQIKLSPRTNLPAGDVKLKDVAELQGPDAIALGDLVVGKLAGDSLTIALSDVRKKLDEKGVNWGRLSLRGFMQCQVNASRDIKAAAPAQAAQTDTEDGNAVANPAVYVANHTMLTVGDRVTAALVMHCGFSKDELRIEFAARDQEALVLSVLQDRWEIEPLNSAKLGRVLVTVRQWQGDRIVNTYRLSADIARRVLCVVAKRDMKRNDIFGIDDVAIQEVYLQDEHNEPASELRTVIGKVAKQPVNKGQVVIADQTAKPELVKRGDRLSVRCIVGGMVIRTTAKAMESGALGDDISVANVDSNERFMVRITGNREAILSTSKPAAPAASTMNPSPSVLTAAKESRS